MYRARHSQDGRILIERLRAADTHLTRLRGLLGTKELPKGEGLWIKPCQQVHMFGMGYAIDVVFLDENQRVLDIQAGLKPWALSRKLAAARSVVELPEGAVEEIQLKVGDELAIDGDSTRGEADWFDNAAAILCNIALAAVYAFFALAHIRSVEHTGYWSMTLPFVAQEGLLVLLFLTRRRSFGTTGNITDWLVGIGGTFLPLFLRPSTEIGVLSIIGAPLQVIGFSLAIYGLMSLGRSIGIVAANRGIQTDGFYKIVRHPMYASYMVTYAGYVMCYSSTRNLLLVASTYLLLYLRVEAEEKFLKQDPIYRKYVETVRWRFLPFLY